MAEGRLTTPDQWARSLARPLAISSESSGWRSGLIRRWTGGSAIVVQPPIDHHYLVLHLGGPKHVTRCGGGSTVTTDVADRTLTLVPAGTRYDWTTAGPIDFAHLYVHPSRLGSLVAARYSGDPAAIVLEEKVGFSDPLLAHLMCEMLDQASCLDAGVHSYLDALLEAALAQLARKHTTAGEAIQPLRSALTSNRLRRVIDYVEAHLADSLRLEDLAAASGLSRFHFSRSFQSMMGAPPMTYLNRCRIDCAKRLLRASDLSAAEIGRRSGLGAPSQFAATFKRITGSTPTDYRRQV